jgi:hypothetical protein
LQFLVWLRSLNGEAWQLSEDDVVIITLAHLLYMKTNYRHIDLMSQELLQGLGVTSRDRQLRLLQRAAVFEYRGQNTSAEPSWSTRAGVLVERPREDQVRPGTKTSKRREVGKIVGYVGAALLLGGLRRLTKSERR